MITGYIINVLRTVCTCMPVEIIVENTGTVVDEKLKVNVSKHYKAIVAITFGDSQCKLHTLTYPLPYCGKRVRISNNFN